MEHTIMKLETKGMAYRTICYELTQNLCRVNTKMSAVTKHWYPPDWYLAISCLWALPLSLFETFNMMSKLFLFKILAWCISIELQEPTSQNKNVICVIWYCKYQTCLRNTKIFLFQNHKIYSMRCKKDLQKMYTNCATSTNCSA